MKRITILIFLIIGFFSIQAQSLVEDYQWSVIKDKDGIKIFKNETPGVKFEAYKAETIINQSLETLLEVIHDVPSYPQWLTGNKKASIIKMLSPRRIDGNMIIYMVWDAMWPINNRDLVVKITTKNDWDNDRVIIRQIFTDEYNILFESGLVRMEHFFAEYQFSYIERETTRVSYICSIDPGGKASPGLSKIQTSNTLFKTMKALAKQAEKPIYTQRAKEDYF